jgi:hypothetical protein
MGACRQARWCVVAATLLGLVVYEDLFDREQEPTAL